VGSFSIGSPLLLVPWEGEVMLLFALAVGDLMTSAFGFLADIDREKKMTCAAEELECFISKFFFVALL